MPTFAEAYALALQFQQAGNFPQAVRCCEQILQFDPQNADVHHLLGILICQSRGNLDNAVAHFRLALRARPNFADAENHLGNALLLMGRLEEAAAQYYRALQLRPDYAEAFNNLGNVFAYQKKYEEAITCFRQAVQLNPVFVDALDNLGLAFEHLGQLDEAIHWFRQTLVINPNSAKMHNRLGCSQLRWGRWDLALESFRHALRLQPDFAKAQSNYLFCLNYDPAVSPQTVFEEHCRWGSEECLRSGARDGQFSNSPIPERRLRVGYVSPDFCQHAVMRCLEPVLVNHDRQSVEVFCYAEVPNPDLVTARLQDLGHHWGWTCNLSDAQVGQQICEDQIDILVDLAGHTSGHRLGVFALKPAPVQATWLGYLNTTGLTCIDYRLTDGVLDPPGQSELDTEELFRLPCGMNCFAQPADAPAVGPLPALQRGYLTFGAVHNLFKFNTDVFDVWSEVLRRVAKSKLLVFRDTLTAMAQRYLRDQFGRRGIAGERLELRQERCTAGYLGIFNEIDVSLDTFPSTGGVTTCEALWMGVPVLSLCGSRPMARNSASLLSRVGLQDWITQTPADYVAAAARLPGELPRLAELRTSLRERMMATICDARRFTCGLEEAYREMWSRWCASQKERDARCTT